MLRDPKRVPFAGQEGGLLPDAVAAHVRALRSNGMRETADLMEDLYDAMQGLEACVANLSQRLHRAGDP